jgi:hypothetical protein
VLKEKVVMSVVAAAREKLEPKDDPFIMDPSNVKDLNDYLGGKKRRKKSIKKKRKTKKRKKSIKKRRKIIKK